MINEQQKRPELNNHQKALLENMQNAYLSTKDEFVIYLRKPLRNRKLGVIGYCAEIATFAYSLASKPNELCIVTPVPPHKCNIYDVSSVIPNFSEDMIQCKSFSWNKPIKIMAFCYNIKIVPKDVDPQGLLASYLEYSHG